MTSLTGLPQSAVLLFATFGFAGLAWTTNAPNPPEDRCDHIEVVQYLPMSEPVPIMPPVQGIGWPLWDRQRLDDAAPVVAKEETVAEESAPVEHYYRRHSRRRRR